jgi:hypothetical protein
MAGDKTVQVRIVVDDTKIRAQVRDAIRRAVAHKPEMLAELEAEWAEQDRTDRKHP